MLFFFEDFPKYFQLKTALEENNSYSGSHIDNCYQCVLRFSNSNKQEFEDDENSTYKFSDLYTTSYHSLNGERNPNLIYCPSIQITEY